MQHAGHSGLPVPNVCCDPIAACGRPCNSRVLHGQQNPEPGAIKWDCLAYRRCPVASLTIPTSNKTLPTLQNWAAFWDMLGHKGTNECNLQIWEMEAAFVGVFKGGQGRMQSFKDASCELVHKNWVWQTVRYTGILLFLWRNWREQQNVNWKELASLSQSWWRGLTCSHKSLPCCRIVWICCHKQ